MIELTYVTKVFPGMEKPVVDCVPLSIGAGEPVVLLGFSGFGKSTTLKLINRLLELDSGTIRRCWEGEVVCFVAVYTDTAERNPRYFVRDFLKKLFSKKTNYLINTYDANTHS